VRCKYWAATVAVGWYVYILRCVLQELGWRQVKAVTRARKRSFVVAATKSMYFAGRQFVRVDVCVPVRVRTSVCLSVALRGSHVSSPATHLLARCCLAGSVMPVAYVHVNLTL